MGLRLFSTLIFVFSCWLSNAQTYTFECVSGARLTGDSCDICPNTIVESRSFNGLVIFRNGDFYRWLDQPYSIRVKPGGIIEYWEHSVNPYSERVTVALSLTGFSTIQGMADSTWCNSPGPQRYQELSLDSLSTTLAKARISGSNTGFGLRAGSGITFDFQNDTLEVIGGGTPDANNGVSNNEDGGKLRLGNRYMGTPDAPFTMARKINVDGRLLHIGDLSDSTLFVVDGATDRIGIRTDAPAKDLHVNGEVRISDLTNGTPDRVTGANSSGDLSRLYLSGMSVIGGVLTATDSSTTNEIQTYGHAGTTTYTNTLSDGGGSFSITGAGIAAISQTAGAVTVTATEVDGSVSNELQTIANTNDATSHTATLSNSGGSLKIAEGTGITIATTGTGLDGVATITNSTPDQTVSITGAGINVVTGTYPNFTITGTEVGNGTVTDFSAGNLSPLFTTTEATTTTTPALSFALSNAGANTYFGFSGDAGGAPSYNTFAALTKTDDTNVTMTLGGTPASSLLRSVSMTLGWTGTLSAARGGTGNGTYAIGDLLQANTTTTLARLAAVATGNVLISGGVTTVSSWGKVGLSTHVSGDLPFANLTQGSARSVLGVTGNATADMASIQGTADQVLRVNTAGTALAFGTVATAGIADQAVTYGKMQNAVANNVFLANNNGANTAYEEINAAAAQTILGYIDGAGANQHIPYFTDGNTVASEAAMIWNATDDRMTLTSTTPGSGAGNAILNLTNVGTDATGEFLQMRGNMSGNMIAGMTNTNNTAGSNTIWTLSTGGSTADDPVIQFIVSGVTTTAIGVDNSDGDRFKITPNSASPGGNANMGIIVRDNSGTGSTGINKDFPTHPLDGVGKAQFNIWQNTGNEWGGGNIAFGGGAGTGPSVNTIVGTGNDVRIDFSTGTTPGADGDVLTATYPFTFSTTSIVTFSARDDDAAIDIAKFYISAEGNASFTLKVKGTLTASRSYKLNFHFGGY